MQRITRKMLVKALGITVLALALSLVIAQPVAFSVFSIFSAPHRNEVTLNDFYAQMADDRPIRIINQDIVIVNIENCDRYCIAQLITEIKEAGAAVIGVDVVFSNELSERDSILTNAVENAGKIVLAEKLYQLDNTLKDGDEYPVFDYDDVDFFKGSIKNMDAHFASANFVNEKEGAVIRDFCPQFLLKDGNQFLSFATAIAGEYRPESTKQLIERGNAVEIISYPSKYFEVIEPDMLAEKADALKGKIVLLGDMHSAYDMHATPISHYQPGVVIHAYIISTILDGVYYKEVGKAFTFLIAFFLCFLVVLASVYSGLMLKGLMVRILQVVFVVAAVAIGFSLFIHRHIVLDFTFILLMVTFGIFAADIWNGVSELRQRHKEKIKKEKE